jgi:hypothetical protein
LSSGRQGALHLQVLQPTPIGWGSCWDDYPFWLATACCVPGTVPECLG